VSDAVNLATRPTRLAPWEHWLVAVLLGLSFVSGSLVWFGQTIQERDAMAPPWLHPLLVLHGVLNPFQCALFGWLAYQHIRVGWRMRANLLTGIAMEFVFAGLILTGIGLYYAGEPEWRGRFVWTHRALGLLLPATLAVHWVAGVRWGKRNEK
jgi:hypothetical protein